MACICSECKKERKEEAKIEGIKALNDLIKSIEEWEKAIIKIIGRRPQTYIELEVGKAVLKKFTENGGIL